MLQKPENDTLRELYAPSLVKHQVQFVKCQPGHVKDFIRLVKYCAYSALPENLHKSYFLELLTIHLWEESGKPDSFSKVQGLKNIMETLESGHTELKKMYWPQLYDNALAVRAIDKLGMHEWVLIWYQV